MRKKKLWIVIFAVVLALQIATPVGMILWHTDVNRKILEEGTEYRLRAQLRQVTVLFVTYELTYATDSYYTYEPSALYYILTPDSDGFMNLTMTQKKPSQDTIYFSEDAYNSLTLNLFEYEAIEELHDNHDYYRSYDYNPDFMERLWEEECTLTIRVYRHRYTITGLYDSKGRPVEVFIKELLNAYDPMPLDTQEWDTP